MSLALSNGSPISMLLGLTGAALIVGTLYRYGLLTLLSAQAFFHVWVFFPITTEFSAWYAGDFVLALVIFVALAAYGFYTSLGDQKVFRASLLQD
jgi:hypothetical protein